MVFCSLPAATTAAAVHPRQPLQDVLHSRFRVEVPVKTLASTLYVRISAHVYNTLDDYRVLAAAVQQLQQEQQQQH
jgi:selenocysteine lyase/cysteine desulfurase